MKVVQQEKLHPHLPWKNKMGKSSNSFLQDSFLILESALYKYK